MKTGRKTIHDSMVVVIGERAMPPPPPSELSPAEARIWADCLGSLPSTWILPAHHGLMMDYCRRAATAERLGREIEAFESSWLEVPGGVERYNALLLMRDRESRAMFAAGRQLRLTPASVSRRENARTLLDSHRPGPLPWDKKAR